MITYDDYKPYLDLNSPSGDPVPIPDAKPRYASVKPKTESTITKEVLCRKKRATTEGRESLTLGMDSTEDQILA